MSSWIDITVPLTDGMVHWPGDRDVSITRSDDMARGAEANVTTLELSAHTGTHLDAPLHFIQDGADIMQLPLDVLIGEALVVAIADVQEITEEHLKGLQVKRGGRILFKTKNSSVDWSRQPFMDDYAYIGPGAAQWLADAGVTLIGVDYLSVGGGDSGSEVHRVLLGAGIVIVEGLKLGEVAPGTYDLVCLPLKIAGADGAPARVVVRKR